MAEAKRILDKETLYDSVALSIYPIDEMPEDLASRIRHTKLPESVRHVALMVLIKDNSPKRVVEVYFADQIEEALKIAARDGLFVVER